MNFDKELDASGLNCPLPILRAKKALNDMTSGQILRIIATDPGSVKDFDAFAKQTGNELLESTEEGGKFYYSIKKK
jgi:tRNA 2-thiouridine synthesizing protein A